MKIKEKVLKEVEKRLWRKIEKNEDAGGDGIVSINDLLKDVEWGLRKTLAEVGKVIDEWLNEYCSHGKDNCLDCIKELKQKLGIEVLK